MLSFLSLAFVSIVPSALAAPLGESFDFLPRAQSTGCEALSKTYPSLTFSPNSTIYGQENTAFWSESTILSPSCVFTPESSQDVSGAVKILVRTNTPFAVRGGGHMPIPGAASTSSGVLIAMDRLASLDLATSTSQQVARIGAGLRWNAVYEWLAPQKLTVIGGRYAPVGVGGFMLGGGVSYYLSARGWGVNHVRNYEIVTADGSILQVNATSNPDLFWAIKGGSNNFGIATRFDLETFPLPDIYGGFVASYASQVDQVVKAVADYISPPSGGNFDELSAVAANLEFTTDTRVLSAVTSLFYNASVDTTPKAFENFTSIPSIAPSTVTKRSLLSFLSETAPTGDRNSNKQFSATSLKCTPEAVQLIAKAFKDEIKNVRNVTGGVVTVGFQMVAQSSLQAAVDAGGDAIDLDPKNGAVMTVLVSSLYAQSSDSDYIKSWIGNLIAKIDKQSKAASQYYPFIYLNDAGEGQKSFPLYGNGKSLAKMKATAKKYDPNGVFQRLVAGAFKLS